MENSISVKDYKEIHRTPKAILVEIENSKYWFPLSKIEINSEVLEIDTKIFENKKFINENGLDSVKIFFKVEDYSEKVYKIVVKIKRENFESDKFIFIPKSQAETIEDDFLIVPKWVWDEKVNQIKKQEYEYYINNFEEKVCIEDYKVSNGKDWF